MKRKPPLKEGWKVVESTPTGWALTHPNGLKAVATYGLGWDHVSVSRKDRIPTWEEMCFVKDCFFDPEDCVVQYHPPRSKYRNCHPRCLHLWRPQAERLPMPPLAMV